MKEKMLDAFISLESIVRSYDENTFWLSIGGTALTLFIIQLAFTVSRKKAKRHREPEQPPASVAPVKQSLEPVETEPLRDSAIALHEQVAEPEEVEVAEATATTATEGLTKSRVSLLSRLRGIFGQADRSRDEILESIEELLISSDLGVGVSQRFIEQVKAKPELTTATQILAELKALISSVLQDEGQAELEVKPLAEGPTVLLVVGVNGVGKTTTIGKLCFQLKAQGYRVLVGACDTFRAAAVEQLTAWADRAGVDIVARENAKPAAVAYDAVHKAKNEGYHVLILDTAGRLHTRSNLMNELGSVVSIIDREYPGAPHDTFLVVDGSTGQNAMQQAREFSNKTNLTGVVVTKLDGTSKGGIVVAIKDELQLPIRYVGFGEQAADLRPFEVDSFVEGLLAVQDDDEIQRESEPEEKQAVNGAPVRAKRRRQRT